MKYDRVKKPFYKKWWVWLLAIIIIGAALSGGGDDGDPAGVVKNPVQESPKTSNEVPVVKETPVLTETPVEENKVTVAISVPATIADVSFTVNSVEETKEISSGNQYIDNATTEGKFIVVNVTVKNDKKEAITINSSFFKLITTSGVEYDPNTDGKVMMAMMEEENFFLQQVNPGLSKTGKVVFEVGSDLDLNATVLRGQTGFWGTETVEISLKK
jgi:hypothetical protein